MFAADRGVKQLEATSQYRARPCLEWSKQISRSAAPFFAETPTANPRQSSGSEGPQRHKAAVLLDKVPGRDSSPTFGKRGDEDDGRSYDPYRFEEGERHCPTNWKRAAPRVTMSGAPQGGAQAESVLDPFAYPGWGNKGSGGTISKAERDTIGSTKAGASRSGPLHSDELNFSAVRNEFVMPRTLGGPMSKAPREASMVLPNNHDSSSLRQPQSKASGTGGNNKSSVADNTSTSLNESHVKNRDRAEAEDGVDRALSFLSRNRGTVTIGRVTARDRPKKLSQSYKELLRDAATPPPVGAKMRITQGFAPMRANHRLTLHDLLGQTSKDVTRARSVMGRCFGERSRSELRTAALYTPPPL